MILGFLFFLSFLLLCFKQYAISKLPKSCFPFLNSLHVVSRKRFVNTRVGYTYGHSYIVTVPNLAREAGNFTAV